MRGSRSWGTVGLAVLAAVIALIGGVGGLVALTRTVASDVPGADGRRRLGETGVQVAVPRGWVDKRHAAPGALLLEVEHRPVAGVPLAARGMWVGRWSFVGGAPDEVWTTGPEIGGHPSVHREDTIGPSLLRRLPTQVTLRRSIFRVEAYDHVYEIGFWGPSATVGDEVERTVLSRVSIDEPPPIELAHDGVSVTVPFQWNRGDCSGAKPSTTLCAFSPATRTHPNDSWVYVFPWKSDSLEAGTEQLLASLSKQPNVREVVSGPVTLAGEPAMRVRFGMAPKDTGPAEVEELLVHGRTGFVLIAIAWRTPEGRAQLDSVMQTLRL